MESEIDGIVTQFEIAGNNSQSLENNVLKIGNDKEPGMLHAHIVCRGNPKVEYIPGVALGGPPAGNLFNMRGDGLDEGNTKKTKWNESELKTAISFIKNAFLKNIYGEHNSSINIKNLTI